MPTIRSRGSAPPAPSPSSAPAPAFAAALALLLVALAAAPASGADDFAPITDAERALKAVPGDPSAPAVVLFERGRMKLLEWPRDMFSLLEIEVRVKILDERGVEMFGEVEIEHSRFLRLSGFKGRTVLPDGRELKVDEDSIFVEPASRSRKIYLTKATFPGIEPGAILDYRYALRWDNFLTFEPWLFANRVPTLHSEIAYIVPPNLGAKPWGRMVEGAPLETTTERLSTGTQIKVTADNVPAIPDEPWSFPFEDLSSRFLLMPTEVLAGGSKVPLLDSWENVCALAHEGYRGMRRNDGAARRQAKQLIAGATGPRARAEAIYRFVRDEIQPAGYLTVFVGDEGHLDRVLKERRGSPAEQALLLEAMLDAAGLEPKLVWAADRHDGRVDLTVANPYWFERVLVMIEPGGERVFLDPLDRNLGFGQLVPGFEGMPALIYDPEKPRVIELPADPGSANARRAEVTLAIDAEGRVEGSGTITLSGHHAWLDRALRGDEEPAERWQKALEEDYPGYDVTGVEVDDARDDPEVRVAWKLALRDEEVLGDEVTLTPSRPIGPQGPRFALPPEQRRTPVQLPFADLEEVALTVTWPEGWAVDSAPETVDKRNPAGTAEQRVAIDEPARTLHYQRRVELLHTEFGVGGPYTLLREAAAAAEKADAQPLVLSAR